MQTFPFKVTARLRDTPPIRLEVMARDTAHAIQTVQELYPDYMISAVALNPEWGDAC